MNRAIQLSTIHGHLLKRTVCPMVSIRHKSTAADAEQHLGNAEKEFTISVPFSSAKFGPFTQEEPRLKNQYLQDPLLKSYLTRHVPQKVCFNDISTSPLNLPHSLVLPSGPH